MDVTINLAAECHVLDSHLGAGDVNRADVHIEDGAVNHTGFTSLKQNNGNKSG